MTDTAPSAGERCRRLFVRVVARLSAACGVVAALMMFASGLLAERWGTIRAMLVARTISTGYGRHNVDFADGSKTELHCHGVGCYHHYPEAITIIDIGCQDNKVIRVDGDGKRLDECFGKAVGQIGSQRERSLGRQHKRTAARFH